MHLDAMDLAVSGEASQQVFSVCLLLTIQLSGMTGFWRDPAVPGSDPWDRDHHCSSSSGDSDLCGDRKSDHTSSCDG